MKKYYLVAETAHGGATPGAIDVFVSDAAGTGRTVLMEIEAGSYSEAVKRVGFHATSKGKTAHLGVDVHGDVYCVI